MQEKKFETSYARLEKIVESLEDENLDLEEALKLYEEGISLSRFCTKKLEEVEKKVQKLTKTSAGEFKEEDFEPVDEESKKADGNT